jgi:hypothetical protein
VGRVKSNDELQSMFGIWPVGVVGNRACCSHLAHCLSLSAALKPEPYAFA